ncbi:MAG: hypothetical protein E7437_09145 [Ruminococcaceae bacterium]|nr:hypothetical protein [Oscillospiraceae bacterium]
MRNNDEKKNTEGFSKLMQKTVDLGKKAAVGAKTGVSAIMEKSKVAAYARKLKKLNPLFPDRFQSEAFNIPNIIMIVDDAVRRDIDVCEGAIGWLGKEAGVEVLYLYDEAVSFSGISFVPNAACDEVYCVDNFDRNRFIRSDCVFGKAHEERMAELKHIAYALGAKCCTIEIQETSSGRISQSKKQAYQENYKNVSGSESMEQSFSQTAMNARSGRIEAEFKGHNAPKYPELKWFAHDDTIKRLIEMCCDGKRSVKSETLALSGASSATMSVKTANSIDGAIGQMFNGKANISMNSEAEKEHNSKLLYHIEF